jgi:peptidoglycan/xylan/chitin deacetylase (PgdA/CDA1 family)
MTLIVLMYHKASLGRHGNSVEMLDAHFSFIARSCRCVLPGEPLDERRLNVALSFDDAYFDFYAMVFPLLRRYGLRASLAVPVSAISDATSASAAIRLQACSQRRQGGSPYGAYCTWPELAEMAASPSISIASHGFTHVRLDGPEVDLHAEIVPSKRMLAARTGQAVDSFVLPYGRFTAKTITYARQHYQSVFRIGSADNAGWTGNVLYRVDADEMNSPDELVSRSRVATFRLRRWWNEIRSR